MLATSSEVLVFSLCELQLAIRDPDVPFPTVLLLWATSMLQMITKLIRIYSTKEYFALLVARKL